MESTRVGRNLRTACGCHLCPTGAVDPDRLRKRLWLAQHGAMRTVIVTDREQEWFDIRDAVVLTARRYLTEADSGRDASDRVLNLCRTARYQGRGYYVSLL